MANFHVEVCGRWLSRNGRVQLTEVRESWSRKKSIEVRMVWASVQDQKAHFDLQKLEKAIKEVYEDLKTLRSFEEEGLAGEKLHLRSNCFHYYPDKDVLWVTLEMLRVQRKELVLESSRDVCSSRRAARCGQKVCFEDQEEDWDNQPETIRTSPDDRFVGLFLESTPKNGSLSERKERLKALFRLGGKRKEK